MNIGETLAYHARNRPDGEALIFGARRLTWRDLDAGANRVANALLALGAGPGERIAYVLENSVEFVETFFGLARIGAIGAPILPGSAAPEITHIVNDLGAKFLICQTSTAPRWRPLRINSKRWMRSSGLAGIIHSVSIWRRSGPRPGPGRRVSRWRRMRI